MSMTTEHELSAELLELEGQLSALTPAMIPSALVDGISQSIDDSDFDDLEQQLTQLGNATMSEEMITRMASAMDRWHEELPVEEKLVPFGAEEKVSEKAPRKSMWAAAAAVALLGSLSALVIPSSEDRGSADMAFANAVQPAGMTTTVSTAPRDAWLVPDSLTHRVTNTVERGIVMSADNTARRRVEIEYLDTVKVLDDRGREIEIERPGVEVILLPVMTN